jgi:hypothetical protein
MIIKDRDMDECIELMYVKKSVYIKYGRGPTIGNLRLLWSKRAPKASGRSSDFHKSEPELQLRLRKTGQNSHTTQQHSQLCRHQHLMSSLILWLHL